MLLVNEALYEFIGDVVMEDMEFIVQLSNTGEQVNQLFTGTWCDAGMMYVRESREVYGQTENWQGKGEETKTRSERNVGIGKINGKETLKKMG